LSSPDRSPAAAEHFHLSFFAALLQLLERLAPAFGSADAIEARFPFLAVYREETTSFFGRMSVRGEECFAAVRTWERTVSEHLPLRAVREALSLDESAEGIWLTVGMIDEDPRFGVVFEDVQGISGQRRPTLALLTSWWGNSARAELFRLIDNDILQVVNPDAPRLERAVQVNPVLWDAIRGDRPAATLSGATFRELSDLVSVDQLIVPDSVREALVRIPDLIARGDAGAVVVRGPRHNGRRTLLGAVARQLGLGVLEIPGPIKPDDSHSKMIGPLSVARNAMPLVTLDLGPGESTELPRLGIGRIPLGVALGRHGGVGGADLDRAITICLDMPDPDARRRHWLAALGRAPAALDELANGFRITSGSIHNVATLAATHAALACRSEVASGDARAACRTLNRQALDKLATRLEPGGDWNDLAVSPDVGRDLDELRTRCRYRESLAGCVGPTVGRWLGTGVRALFTGPSGTGKTLAARLLASTLSTDLYRLELSALVSKYLGETEKNIHHALTLAEEHDVMLLLDEGDALLAPRTGVQNSNDRYANLETNFLLQRLETFDGVLIITTNAGERIDSAFQRRMDVVVEFRPPDSSERWAIWSSHLPAGHTVENAFLRDVAARCPLTGGQIRNAVLHAALLALDAREPIRTGHLKTAVLREYRKSGAICPLRRTNGAID
jgi:hypothetical protein